jgi:hypothetical protein
MIQFIIRVRTGDTFNDMMFTAPSLGEVCQIVEAQFGAGSFLGVIREDRIN